MILKDFLYFLTDGEGKSYRVNKGIVETTTTPTQLPVTPSGWEEKSIRYGRSAKYFGLFRSFTLPLKFIKEGAVVVLDVLAKIGLEAQLYLLIHKLDKGFSGGWKHRFFYRGLIDLSRVEMDDNSVGVSILEGGLVESLKANENTRYEIPVNVPEAKIIKMDGMSFNFSAKWVMIEEEIFTSSMGASESYFSQVTMANVQSENSLLYFNPVSSQPLIQHKITDFANSDLYFATVLSNLTLRMKGSYTFRITQDNDCRDTYVRLQVRNQTGAVVKEFFAFDPPDGSYDHTFTVEIDQTFNVSKDDRLFFGFLLDCRRQFIGGGEATIKAFLTDADISVTYAAKYEKTFVKALPLAYVGQQLLNKMAGTSEFKFQSQYIESEWPGLLVTGMDAIRGIEDSKMKISFSDFYGSINVALNTCLLIKGDTLSVERKADAFRNEVNLELGEAKETVLKVATDHLYNTIKVGWPDIQAEDVNGRDDFHSSQVRTSPAKKSPKELNLVGAAIASPYEIEIARINLSGKPTTTAQTDNDFCFLHTETTPASPIDEGEPIIFTFYKLYRKFYDSITGVNDPAGIFNVELSPVRCLLRHGNYLRSVFYWLGAGSLKFQSSGRNSEFATTLNGVTIAEKADIAISSLGDPLFIPLTATFKCRIPESLMDVMESNPECKVSFEWLGETWKGFIVDIGIQPASNDEQEVTVLLSPDNDLGRLVR